MLSYAVTEFGQAPVPVEAPDPRPQGSEVVLRVLACGVCHSDLHYWHGGYELGEGRRFTLAERGVNLPIVMGHEPLGVVEAVGPDAEGVKPGDRRLVFPWVGCGACSRCHQGRDNDCEAMQTIGLFRPGGYATHIVAPHPRYLFEVDGIGDAEACTLACAGLTAFSALNKVDHVWGDPPVLIGGGGVGLTAVGMTPAILGEAPILVETDPAKREHSLTLGARSALDPREAGAGDRIRREAGGAVATVVDFVGTPETVSFGLDILHKGGKLILVGLYGGALTLSVVQVPLRNISVVGSLVGRPQELAGVIDLVRTRNVPGVPVETRPLDAAGATLADLEAGRVVGRVVLAP